MQSEGEPLVLGFVKVHLRSRSPRLWGWEVCREGTGIAVRSSEDLFRCAEDAWRAGRVILTELETVRRSRRPGPSAA